jgi:methylenetetrahydrofolate reductase (NADPH)
MPQHALTSAEISLPRRPVPARVSERIAILAQDIELVGLTDNHAGEARMSPLAAVALAREQGVRTIVHVSCRDRNRLALRAQVIGAAALGCDGVLCLFGDSMEGVTRVRDMNVVDLISAVGDWSRPAQLVPGCVVNPFARDVGRELDLLRRKIGAGARFAQTQLIFDIPALIDFLERVRELGEIRIFASVGILRTREMADHYVSLPGVSLPEHVHRQIVKGGGIDLARELSGALALVEQVDALHVVPLGDERSAAEIAREFRRARPMAPRPSSGGGCS